jgi:AcrR family transcriptional regulator
MNGPAGGRRERKRRERRSHIADCAARLFRSAGFGSTSVEDIAVAADVAVGTVYNFFPSKADLLVEAIAIDVIAAAARLEGVMPTIAEDPVQGVNALISQYFQSLAETDRGDLRRVVGHGVLAGSGSVAGHAYAAAEQHLKAAIETRLEIYRRLGRLPAGAPVAALADTLFAAISGSLLAWLIAAKRDDAGTLERLAQMVQVILSFAAAQA